MCPAKPTSLGQLTTATSAHLLPEEDEVKQKVFLVSWFGADLRVSLPQSKRVTVN